MIHQYFGQFQHTLLQELAEGKNPKEVAKIIQKLIPEMYKNSKDFELGLGVNNKCNLTCDHCYYASTHNKVLETDEGNLSLKEWLRIIDEALAVGIRHFSLIGKEPLLSPYITKGILYYLEKKKKFYPNIKYELITNGTLIEKNISWLKKLDFYFFSVSFDGVKNIHNSIRAQNEKDVYSLSKRGLDLANKEGIKNLCVTHTSNPLNAHLLDAMIADLVKTGVKYFSIGLCFPAGFNKKALTGTLEVFHEIEKKVRNSPKDINITINLMGEEHSEIISGLWWEGYFAKGDFAVSEDVAPALLKVISETPRIVVLFDILPIMYYGGFRIDYNGDAMDYCDTLQNPQLRKGFGNTRQSSLRELRERALLLWPGYVERYYIKLAKSLLSG